MTDNFTTFNRGIARIYNREDIIIGAGFLVSRHYLLTCAHVIQQALGLQDTTTIPQETVKLDLPSCANLTAKVIYWQPCSSDLFAKAKRGEDIAALEIIEELPLNLELVNLSQASLNREEEVHIFGFPEDYDSGIWAKSVLRGFVFNDWIQMDQIRLDDRLIEGGFSGAPVWDKEKKTVIGMAVASDLGKQKNIKATAFAIPSSILISQWIKFLNLLDILSSDDLGSFKVIEKAYVACRRSGLEKPIPKTIKEIIKDFADEARLNLDKSQMSLDLDKFVLRLIVDSKKVAASSSFELLTQWGKEYIKDFDKALTQEKESHEQSKTQESLTYLMVRFQKSKQFKDRYELSAALIPDSSKYKASENQGIVPLEIKQIEPNKESFNLLEIKQFLPIMLENLLSQSRQNKDCTLPKIVFFLPYALFAEPFETFIPQNEDEDEDEADLPIPLRVRYSVIFRSERRLREKYKYRVEWENKWKQLQACSQEFCRNHFVLDVACQSWENIFTKLDCQTIGFAMTKSPSLENFKAVDETGIPIAIWAKKILESWNYQQEFNTLLECSIEKLPEKIQQKHQEAFGQFPKEKERHFGHYLTLLWEDPYLLPAHIDYSTPS